MKAGTGRDVPGPCMIILTKKKPKTQTANEPLLIGGGRISLTDTSGGQRRATVLAKFVRQAVNTPLVLMQAPRFLNREPALFPPLW